MSSGLRCVECVLIGLFSEKGDIVQRFVEHAQCVVWITWTCLFTIVLGQGPNERERPPRHLGGPRVGPAGNVG